MNCWVEASKTKAGKVCIWLLLRPEDPVKAPEPLPLLTVEPATVVATSCESGLISLPKPFVPTILPDAEGAWPILPLLGGSRRPRLLAELDAIAPRSSRLSSST